MPTRTCPLPTDTSTHAPVEAEDILRQAALLPPPQRCPRRGHLHWTPAHDALLGQASDSDLASLWHLPHQPVWRRRQQLGVPPYGSSCGRTIVWTDAMVADLGVLPDRTVAQRWGLSHASVALKRQTLGLPNLQVRVHWTPAMDAVLGTCDDARAAERLGVTRNSVIHRRQILGIPAHRAYKYAWSTPEFLGLLATLPIRTLARKAGLNPATVRRYRYLAGIAPRPTRPHTQGVRPGA